MIFRHEEKDLLGVVHGDDFVFGGNDKDLKWVAQVLAAKFVIKSEGCSQGPEDEDQKDEVLLGRFVRWRSWGIEWEADVKQRKLLLERFVLDGNAKALTVNGDWGDWVSTAGEDQDTDVFSDEAKEFRAAVARLNFLGQDSPDVQFPAMVQSSEMANPTTAGWRRLKKVVRFLVGRKRDVWRFQWQSVEEAAQLKVITDADWGGGEEVTEIDVWRCDDERQALFEDVVYHTRSHRTVNSRGGIVRYGGRRAEDERYEVDDLGLASCDDVIELQVDSAAGESFISRRGFGKDATCGAERFVDPAGGW